MICRRLSTLMWAMDSIVRRRTPRYSRELCTTVDSASLIVAERCASNSPISAKYAKRPSEMAAASRTTTEGSSSSILARGFTSDGDSSSHKPSTAVLRTSSSSSSRQCLKTAPKSISKFDSASSTSD